MGARTITEVLRSHAQVASLSHIPLGNTKMRMVDTLIGSVFLLILNWITLCHPRFRILGGGPLRLFFGVHATLHYRNIKPSLSRLIVDISR